MTSTVHWDLDLTSLSPIAHREETAGTTVMLRREKIFQPDGRVEQVPAISGNSLRGMLRRIGEELLRDVLDYEGKLSLPAAHALRNGGALGRTSKEGVTGGQLRYLCSLVPQIAVFGCAAGSRTIEGKLQVGKVRPVCQETAHILPRVVDGSGLGSMFDQLTLEPYTHFDDVGVAATDEESSHLMRFEIEAFATGVQFQSWVRVERATGVELSFLREVLEVYRVRGRLGARAGIGFGQVAVAMEEHHVSGPADNDESWRDHLTANASDALEALSLIG
ncbi:RAMP superfamily CRISPR-associated protein [Dietzia cercidiphylli]|jgi:RAMP superfamily|uniref:RAMP superfamily CRISPR-associated protein n=1 Tax=Dietzia cercidiphylli TaxID=498199 RepID=UPI00223A8FDC|nr:RAMP superfamily CRISPR-associated protein [Dietzia cercidiphylli]MCT1515293.1 RAMP superfamily CRISPR-associated protein [Dietzia cercidiphylli]